MSRLFNARTFFVLCALFIFYATTIPWDLSNPPSLSRVAWVPGWDTERQRIWSIPDMVQNVVLFLPFGFFGFLGVERIRARGVVIGSMLIGLLGLSLSAIVELLQTMSATRIPSATDLATNFAGALAGAATAAIYVVILRERIDRALTRTVRESPGMIILGLYFVAIAAGSLAPFLPTLDIGLLRHNVRLFLDDPWGVKPVGALFTDGLLFAALTFLATFELPGFLGRQPWFPRFAQPIGSPMAAALAIASASLLAIGLEMGQMVIVGHSPGVQDMVVGILSAFLGGALAVGVAKAGPIRPARELGELTRRAPLLVIGFAVAAPLCRALQPFIMYDDLSEGIRRVTVWSFVPFFELFRNVNVSTFRNVFEAAAIYLPLGYALHAMGRSPRFGFVVCLLWAEVLEVLQLLIVDRTYDITEGIYAGLMGLLGAHVLIQLRRRRVGSS